MLEGVQLAQRDLLDPENPYKEADAELRHVASVFFHGTRQYHGLGRTSEGALERLRLFFVGEQVPRTLLHFLVVSRAVRGLDDAGTTRHLSFKKLS